MFYIKKIDQILKAESSPYDKWLNLLKVNEEIRAAFFRDKELPFPEEKIPTEKEEGLSRVITLASFFYRRHFPKELWEDLCPNYLAAVEEFIQSKNSFISYDKDKFPIMYHAYGEDEKRRNKLATSGKYTNDEIRDWYEMGH